MTLARLLLQLVRPMALTNLEELILSSGTPKPKALDVMAMPRVLQRLAYHSPASFIHLVSPLTGLGAVLGRMLCFQATCPDRLQHPDTSQPTFTAARSTHQRVGPSSLWQ